MSSLPEVAEESEHLIPQMGIVSVGTYLKEKIKDIDVKIIDCHLENIDETNIDQIIHDFNPGIVGISVVTYLLYDAVSVARAIKRIDENIHINFGGPHIALYPEETLNLRPVDSIVIGDGEIPFYHLVRSIINNENIQIRGLYLKGSNHTNYEPYIANLNDLPYPDRTLTAYKKYKSIFSGSISTSIITSKGCTNKCTMCSMQGSKLRLREIPNIISEIKHIINLGITDIQIYDDTFNISEKRVAEFCEEIIRNDLKFSWSFRGRVNNVNYELLRLCKKAGCKMILYGVESGDDNVLKAIRKNTTVKEIRNAFYCSRKANIETLAYFMVGIPGETLDNIGNSIKLAKEIKSDYLAVSIATSWPGTVMYEEGLGQGLYESDYWKEFAVNPSPKFNPRFWTAIFTPVELIKLRNMFLIKYYFNLPYIINRLIKINSYDRFKKQFKAGFVLMCELFLGKKNA